MPDFPAGVDLQAIRGPGPEDVAPRSVPCDLCGLPVGRARVHEAVGGALLNFCCPGCLHVHQILSAGPSASRANFRQSKLYRSCASAGLIPQDGRAPLDEAETEVSAANAPDLQANEAIRQGLSRELALRIEGMWCTSCSWIIEALLRKATGILEARVLFHSDMARVRYLPHQVSPEAVVGLISGLGYRAFAFEGAPRDNAEKQDLLLRLGISSILTVNIMMISFALYFGLFQELGDRAVELLSYPLFLLATPVVFYGGYPILRRAALGLRRGGTSMDLLIAVGALSAYFYSVVQMLSRSVHVYFDTAGMLVTLVLLGRVIESRARDKVSAGISALAQLAGSKVRLWRAGGEEWVAADAVGAGDELLVRTGERAPVDGRVRRGEALVDESVITGESRPVRRSAGDEVMEGGLLLEGELWMEASRAGPESSLRRTVGLIDDALSRKDPVELLADRITRFIVPAILLVAAATALVLLHGGVAADEALLRAVTVLVITCPCALGIATPLAKVASIGAARSRGILIRSPGAFEKAHELDVLVFDKTGTLTEGNFSLSRVIAVDAPEHVALSRVAAAEAHSSHFLAKAVVRKALDRSLSWPEATELDSFEGLGVRALVEGEEILVGNRRLMELYGWSVPPLLDDDARLAQSEGSTAVYFAWGGKARGLLIFGDPLKEAARDVVSTIGKRAMRVRLVSGDATETTAAVAGALGIHESVGQALPEDKARIIEELQARGHRVGMVGDGVNDAAGLALADVGIAIGRGAHIIPEASDITVLTDDPSAVIDILDLSRLTSRIIRQNLFFAFFYNLLGIPFAISGALNPLVAVVAMFASSLTVIGNTLRITKWRSTPQVSPGKA